MHAAASNYVDAAQKAKEASARGCWGTSQRSEHGPEGEEHQLEEEQACAHVRIPLLSTACLSAPYKPCNNAGPSVAQVLQGIQVSGNAPNVIGRNA